MSFKFTNRPVVGFPIAVSIFDEKGKVVQIKFTAQYHRTSRSDLVDLRIAAHNVGRKEAGLDLLTNKDGVACEWPYVDDEGLLLEKMCGWVGVTGDDNKPLPFSQEALVDLLSSYPELFESLVDGFHDAHRGAREKN